MATLLRIACIRLCSRTDTSGKTLWVRVARRKLMAGARAGAPCAHAAFGGEEFSAELGVRQPGAKGPRAGGAAIRSHSL